MGKRQRDKGARAERELARLLGGRRVPLSGAAGGEFAGDVIALGMRWEVKRRADGWRELYRWLDGKDALAVRADRREWLVVIPLERFLQMVGVGNQNAEGESVVARGGGVLALEGVAERIGERRLDWE